MSSMPKINLLRSKFRLHPYVPFTIAILVFLYLGLNAWIYFYGTTIFDFFSLGLKNTVTSISFVKKQGFGQIAVPASRPTLPPRKIYPLPAGRQSWRFSQGRLVTGPKIQTATVDPVDAANGTTQTVTITVKHDSPVSATVTVRTDTTAPSYPMKLIAGTLTDGTWEASWKVLDTHNYIYRINFLLQSSTGNWSGGLTFR